MMKSANLKIKFFLTFFSEQGRSSSPPGWGRDAGLGEGRQKNNFFLMDGEIHSPDFFSQKVVESNHNHFWFDIYPSDFAGSLARWDFRFPAHEAKFRARLPAKSECRYRTRDGWGSILLCFRKKMMKSANPKIKIFQFFFSEPERSSGWEEMQAWREGRGGGGGERKRKDIPGKGGKKRKFPFWLKRNSRALQKLKKNNKWEEEGKMAGEAKMAGQPHTASQPYTKKNNFF